MRRSLLLALVLPLAACTTHATTLPDTERTRIARKVEGQQRYLRVAVYTGPLWGDDTKLFVSDQPAGEVELLETPGGRTIPPPAAERVLPPGTPVRVRAVEFPTGWLIAQRVVMTPRYNPWVYLDGSRDGRPLVVVLSREVKSYEDVNAELERLLTSDDPASFLAKLPADQRDAILRKEAIEGMSPRALEMAWGFPERRRIDRPAGTEEWIWAGGQRKAFLRDDQVERVERPVR